MAMVERKIIEIDADKCTGCGLCIDACHEGAIQMVNGKAVLVSDIYCDGLGDCLGPCPTDAITMTTRKAEDYDPQAVAQRVAAMRAAAAPLACGCPGSMARELKTPALVAAQPCGCPGSAQRSLAKSVSGACTADAGASPAVSELMNWPVQLRLVSPSAPYFQDADILLAADCTAFAVPDFHREYLQNKPVIITCPKLEDNDPQIAKLAEIFSLARPASLTILRMEVPCCGGLQRIAEEAVKRSGVTVPVETVIVSVGQGQRL